MNNPLNQAEPDHVADTRPMALDAKQAAQALNISTRKLWELTNRKMVPHVRIGRRVLYPADQLKAWLDGQTEGVNV